jgi:O-methyltransferase
MMTIGTGRLDDPYLDFLKKCLTRQILGTDNRPMDRPSRERHPIAWAFYPVLAAMLERRGLKLHRYQKYKGRSAEADTMIDLEDLDNLHACIEAVILDGVPGDFIETGVWRGGACIFMRAALNVYGDQTRKVWVADSFEGFPKPDARHPQREGDDMNWAFNEKTRNG